MLGWIGEIKKLGSQVMAKCNIFADLMLSGTVFHRVGVATEKDRVLAFVFTLVTVNLSLTTRAICAVLLA